MAARIILQGSGLATPPCVVQVPASPPSAVEPSVQPALRDYAQAGRANSGNASRAPLPPLTLAPAACRKRFDAMSKSYDEQQRRYQRASGSQRNDDAGAAAASPRRPDSRPATPVVSRQATPVVSRPATPVVITRRCLAEISCSSPDAAREKGRGESEWPHPNPARATPGFSAVNCASAALAWTDQAPEGLGPHMRHSLVVPSGSGDHTQDKALADGLDAGRTVVESFDEQSLEWMQRCLSLQAELARREEDNAALRQGALHLQEDLRRCEEALTRYQVESRTLRAERDLSQRTARDARSVARDAQDLAKKQAAALTQCECKNQALQEELDLVQCNSDSGQCVVCMTRQATHATVPCGHLSLCEGCCAGLEPKCPICREPSACMIRVFRVT